MDPLPPDPGPDAALDDSAGEQDRSRDSLLLSAQLCLPITDTSLTVRIRNLSAGGLMAEYANDVAIGDPVKIEVRGIGWVNGTIAWIAAGRIGIAFDEAIDPKLARKPVPVPARPLIAPKWGRSIR